MQWVRKHFPYILCIIVSCTFNILIFFVHKLSKHCGIYIYPYKLSLVDHCKLFYDFDYAKQLQPTVNLLLFVPMFYFHYLFIYRLQMRKQEPIVFVVILTPIILIIGVLWCFKKTAIVE